MYTVDRINALVKALFIHNITFGKIYGRGHKILNVIDTHVGIDTRRSWCSYASGAGYAWRPALLGERLRRLERHVFGEQAPAYFHLGAQAEQSSCQCKYHH